MDQLNQCCFNAKQFPKGSTLVFPGTYEHYLERYYDRLKDNENRLFCEEPKSAVDIFQLEENTQGSCRVLVLLMFEQL